MIIARIGRGLRNQNWSTLVLEILVVIIGIFLGLQADSWYESKSRQRELDSYFVALSDELAKSASIRKDYVRFHGLVIDGLKKVLNALDGSRLAEDEEKLAYFALINVGNPPTSPQRIAVLRAMQAGGMLQIIESPALRQLLGEILSGLDAEYSEYERYVSAIDAPPFSADIVGFALDSDDQVVVTSVDWNLARKEPAFRQRVLQGIRAYSDLVRLHEDYVVRHENVLQILAERGFEPPERFLEGNRDRAED